MTTKDYQQKGMFSIFLSFFKPHRGLFFLDMVCALFVALVDLAYPVISRKAINTLLPNLQYKTFFVVMGIVVLAYVFNGQFPIKGLGNGNLFIGFAFMLAGFLMTMGWK